MARIRTVKPEVYRHEGLFEIEKRTGLPVRLFWIGLFAVCDREGRFKWRPGSIKLDVLPFDDVDVSALLDELWAAGFLVRYRFKNEDLGCIPTFPSHQVINSREAQSKLPPPSDKNCEVLTYQFSGSTETHVHAHVMRTHAHETHVHAQGEGKGREGKGRERKGTGREEEGRVVALAPANDESLGGPASDSKLNLSEPVSPKSEVELLRILPRHVLQKWADLYSDAEYLNRELKKAWGYCQINPRKRPHNRRGWSQFLSNWFERDWHRHQARIPGTKPDDVKLAEWVRAGQSDSVQDPQHTLASVLEIAGGRA